LALSSELKEEPEDEIADDLLSTPVKRKALERLPSSKLMVKKTASVRTPKVKKPDSRRRLTKIVDTPQDLSNIQEESNEEGSNQGKSFIQMPEMPNFNQEDPQDEEMEQEDPMNVDLDELPDIERKESLVNSQYQFEVKMNMDAQDENEDEHLIEDEVQRMFQRQKSTDFEMKRRHSSVSEVKIKQVEDLLVEDDND
jgi:hypothetical protein